MLGGPKAMTSSLSFWKKPWKWEFLAFAAGVLYFVLVWHFVHFQDVMIDEGAYLYKGWLFIRGIYKPFQPYGPWTNKMPLSFLMYGVVQRLIGPGLATGRFFSALSTAVGLTGMWLLVRRLGDRRFATLSVWMYISTIALTRIAAWSVTEGICSAVMVWALFFLLDENPRKGYLFAGGVLTGLISALRINLVLFTVLVPIWSWRLHGWRKARWVIGGAVLPIVVVYSFYWPDILRLWFPWLPAFARRWLQEYGVNMGHYFHYVAPAPLGRRLGAVVDMLRVYPLPWLTLVEGTIIMFGGRQKAQARREKRFRRYVLQGLTILVWGLVLVHLWATIGKGKSLLFQMTVYWAFFAPLAFTLGALALAWSPEGSVSLGGRRTLAIIALAFLVVGIMSGWYLLKAGLVFGVATLGILFHMLIGLKLPPGPFENPYVLSGAVVGVGVILVLSLVVWKIWRGKQFFAVWEHWWSVRDRWGSKAILIIFLVLSPLPLWSGSFRPYDCSVDALAQHRAIGEVLTSVVPPNATIYLQGIESVSILLYLPYNVRTFPPQYNDAFNYRAGGDANALYRYGFWNAALARQWRREADVLLVSKGSMATDRDLRAFLQRGNFEEVAVTPPLTPCTHGPKLSRIIVYKRHYTP